MGLLQDAIRPYARAGGFYARSWRRYLDGDYDGDLPVVRPTVALAGQASSDEVVLVGFRLLRNALTPGRPRPHRRRGERGRRALRVPRVVRRTRDGYLGDPPPLTEVTVRPMSLGPQELRAGLLRQRLRASTGRPRPRPLAVLRPQPPGARLDAAPHPSRGRGWSPCTARAWAAPRWTWPSSGPAGCTRSWASTSSCRPSPCTVRADAAWARRRRSPARTSWTTSTARPSRCGTSAG